ncbi:MAG: hypothetical protein A2096_02330 [Spirochaetes bacterium GWF1_41_5]|nr:MAG: hypothetical protein A2096_02330 [Spirochaetes bacterium GWF1_41_5]HBE01467.1 DUF3467 domain-containing protein [Spirochaetia bacterium]
MNDRQTDNKNFEIQLDDQTAQGSFCNLVIMNHTDNEFVFDFIYMQPNTPKGKVRARIIMTPDHARRLQTALIDNIQKYDAKYPKPRQQAE